MKVYLIGVGLGNSDTLTAAARQAIEECPVLMGAPRLLKEYEGGGKTCLPLIAAADIADAIHRQENGPVAVLLSGDVGFYSGAKNLYPLLEDCDLTVLPGLSSMVYFCAALRTPWQDVFPVSAHGRAHNAPGEIQCHGRTFVLTGGGYRAGDLCRELTEWGMGEVRVTVGERLSYPTETITAGTAAELAGKGAHRKYETDEHLESWLAGQARGLADEKLLLLRLTEVGAEVDGRSVTVFYEGSTYLLGGLEVWEEETAKRLNPVNYIRNSRRLKNLIE